MFDLVNDIEANWDDWIDENTSDSIPPNIKKVVAPLKAGVRDDRDQVLINSSHKRNGLGKSALSYWEGRFIDKKYEIDRNTFFYGGLGELKKKGMRLPKYSSVVLDEILGLLYKRRASTSDVVTLNIWLGEKQRKTDQALIGNIPDFWDLDKYMRGGKCSYLIEILDRGIGAMFEPDDFIRVDPWHEDEFDAIISKRKRGRRETPLDKLKLLKNHYCYKGPVFWPDFVKEDKKEYLRLVKYYGELDENKAIVEEERTRETARNQAYRAIVKAVQLIQLRGVKKHVILKELGISEVYPNYVKALKKSMEKEKEIENAGKILF